MNKMTVKVTRTEEYNFDVEVEANTRKEAVEKVAEAYESGEYNDKFSSPDEVITNYTPIEECVDGNGLAPNEMEDLKNWCCGLGFNEDQDRGIGTIEVKFRIRDTDMRALYEKMTDEDAKELLVFFIISVAEPCDDFDEDMHFTREFDGTDAIVLKSDFFRM